MDNVITFANLMTDESRKIYRTKNPGPNWELEATIKLRYSSIEALKDLSYNNSETYDQIIMRLIKSYNERVHKRPWTFK